MRNPAAKFVMYVVSAIAVLVGAYWQQSASKPEPRTSTRRTAPPPSPAPSPSAERPSTTQSTSAARTRYDLSAITDTRERETLRETLALIDRGGPFPHRQDGQTFGNRERRLPEAPRGYYREYTIRTPGERTRGARRVVQGTNGDTYYTRDHYRTFIKIAG